jgi:glutathione synthase/RimK-type ligase-like ATP-grasp enzyme
MRSSSPNGYVGIMVCETNGALPFPEKQYFRKLCLIGEQAGLRVFVFSPLRMDWEAQQVRGYTYSRTERGWRENIFPLPHLIYDRCFYNGIPDSYIYRESIHRLLKNRNVAFLGRSLGGKWHVQQTLLQETAFHPHLPDTELYRGAKMLRRRLDAKGEVFLKPLGGSQGRGVLHIVDSGDGQYFAKGRDVRNRPILKRFYQSFALYHWIKPFIGNRPYLAQDYLDLTTQKGEVYDIRSLVQKNRQGQWQLVGIAVRLGSPGSVTSNLHGGGRAAEANSFLSSQFGDRKAAEILSCINKLSHQIPPVLEQSHGRLVELGIDFGVDRDGRVWILEVNSKPGRSVFTQLNDTFARRSAVKNPIDYASYLLERRLGG